MREKNQKNKYNTTPIHLERSRLREKSEGHYCDVNGVVNDNKMKTKCIHIHFSSPKMLASPPYGNIKRNRSLLKRLGEKRMKLRCMHGLEGLLGEREAGNKSKIIIAYLINQRILTPFLHFFLTKINSKRLFVFRSIAHWLTAFQ